MLDTLSGHTKCKNIINICIKEQQTNLSQIVHAKMQTLFQFCRALLVVHMTNEYFDIHTLKLFSIVET